MYGEAHDRASFLRAACTAAAAGIALGRGANALAAAAVVAKPGPTLTPAQALRRLMAGNARFVPHPRAGDAGAAAGVRVGALRPACFGRLSSATSAAARSIPR